MKTVRLNSYRLPDLESAFSDRKKYSVYIGNGYSAKFNQKREALAFLSKCSKFLTYQSHQVNACIVSAWTEYRMAWPYFKNKMDASNDLVAMEFKIRNCIESSMLLLDRCMISNPGPNHNHFVFQNMVNSCRELNRCFIGIQTIHKRRNAGAEIARISGLIQKVDFILNDLQSYPISANHDKAAELFEYVLKVV